MGQQDLWIGFCKDYTKEFSEKKIGIWSKATPNDLDDNVDRTWRALQKSLPKIKG